jgi:transcriptional regulator with XRE-family HTH domain
VSKPVNGTDERRRRLIEELKDKEYRDEYVSAGVDVGVAFQIKRMRECQKPKPWTQTDLSNRANMKQPRIHELEDPNPASSPNLSTLKKIASAFDVGLLVRFVPFSDLVKQDINLSSDSLDVLSFEQEDYFHEAALEGREWDV